MDATGPTSPQARFLVGYPANIYLRLTYHAEIFWTWSRRCILTVHRFSGLFLSLVGRAGPSITRACDLPFTILHVVLMLVTLLHTL
jgi:hypothetical protein